VSLIRQRKEKCEKFFKNLTFSKRMIIINCEDWGANPYPQKIKKGGVSLWKT